MADYKRVKVIINPAAGQAEPVLSVLNDVLGGAEIEWDVAITHKPGDGVTAAREAVEQGFDLVGAYGGDGTVAEVASALAGGEPRLLLLPGGTGNALADDLGIPSALAEAVSLALDGASTVRRVDLGRAGERVFVLRLTMGFEADAVGATTPEMKERFGWLAYVMAGLQTLADPPRATYTVTVDGESFEIDGLAATIANSASTGIAGVSFAGDVDVSDGLLDVVVFRQAGAVELLGAAASSASGQESDAVSRWRGKAIRIEASPSQVVLADGEDAGLTPVDAIVMPGAVGVLVPKPADADESRPGA